MAGCVPGGPCRVDELGRERLHPPVDRDGVDLDTAFGEQLLNIALGQADQRTATAITSRGKL
jgi:hypothetical protein